MFRVKGSVRERESRQGVRDLIVAVVAAEWYVVPRFLLFVGMMGLLDSYLESRRRTSQTPDTATMPRVRRRIPRS
jgi:hypothetical protein